MAHGRNKNQSRENRARVREVFLREWDLVGVAGNPEAKDEYDAYADRAYVMLMDERASAEAIATYLLEIATMHMGLSRTAELAARCDRAARALAALRPEFETH